MTWAMPRHNCSNRGEGLLSALINVPQNPSGSWDDMALARHPLTRTTVRKEKADKEKEIRRQERAREQEA